MVGDLLTRIVARVAVPFYFMATGLFTISRYHRDNGGRKKHLKKIGFIYAAAVLLYLPLNIYQDDFNRPNLLPNLLRGLVFDGTVYHLWHLPAAMLGLAIVWRLVEKLDYPKGLAVAAVLYLVGLFGDSYYGIVGRLPVVYGRTKAAANKVVELGRVCRQLCTDAYRWYAAAPICNPQA